MTDASTPWWQTATGYQIYPRSFADDNGDGIGDIPGIISRLDHLADLGIGFIWLSPVYQSPMADNGYDISDYRAVAPEFGTMADMDRLIAEARARGIRIVMDLVVNHTSDKHRWFETAASDPDTPEHNFYVWRKPAKDGGPPTDLKAAFGGSAWHWVEGIGKYYLGYFSAAQPDLNWQNPALRAEIYDMMNWWLDRGIGGFRMDVISLIGKDVDAGIFEEGPDLHRFLQEMHREALAGRDILTVGESWSVSPETAPLYSGRDRGELDMVFQFNHVMQGWDPEHGKWKPLPFDLPRFKAVFNAWQKALADDGWNALFLSNHDLPRQVSTYGNDGPHRIASAKMLATVTHLMRGTPFVYQGEEIGMTNRRFEALSQVRDVETLGHWDEQSAVGVTLDAFLAGVSANGRDNARTPMQWTPEPGAGFTNGTPWIDLNPNHTTINVSADRGRRDSIFAHYQRLIALRHQYPVITHGRYRPFARDHKAVFAYTRTHGSETLVVIGNFTGDELRFELPEGLWRKGTDLLASDLPEVTLAPDIVLAPYASHAILLKG